VTFLQTKDNLSSTIMAGRLNCVLLVPSLWTLVDDDATTEQQPSRRCCEKAPNEEGNNPFQNMEP
jgi:hypothetical protein